jgi:hypothetical protein
MVRYRPKAEVWADEYFTLPPIIPLPPAGGFANLAFVIVKAVHFCYCKGSAVRCSR